MSGSDSDKTQKLSDASPDARTILSSGKPGTPDSSNPLDAATRLVGPTSTPPPATEPETYVPARKPGASAATQARGAAPGGPAKTQLVKPNDPGISAEPKAESGDPVVGWLVVTDGPGKGNSVPIGGGMNAVGRGADQRVSLNFGDTSLSSEKHFMLSFDARSGSFAIHRGDSVNLTYLNDAPVYETQPLKSFDKIETGATKLTFVAFCGEQFSW